jgi:hypothetical protein
VGEREKTSGVRYGIRQANAPDSCCASGQPTGAISGAMVAGELGEGPRQIALRVVEVSGVPSATDVVRNNTPERKSPDLQDALCRGLSLAKAPDGANQFGGDYRGLSIRLSGELYAPLGRKIDSSEEFMGKLRLR